MRVSEHRLQWVISWLVHSGYVQQQTDTPPAAPLNSHTRLQNPAAIRHNTKSCLNTAFVFQIQGQKKKEMLLKLSMLNGSKIKLEAVHD